MDTLLKHPLYSHVHPPYRLDNFNLKRPFIFLSGTDDTECSPNWHDWVAQWLQNLPVTVFNPRGNGFNPKSSKYTRNLLVDWEMDYINVADLIILYFYPGTLSTTSLLMLALYIGSKKSIVVCCPNGYWKKKAVQVLCQRGSIALFETSEEFKQAIREIANTIIYKCIA